MKKVRQSSLNAVISRVYFCYASNQVCTEGEFYLWYSLYTGGNHEAETSNEGS